MSSVRYGAVSGDGFQFDGSGHTVRTITVSGPGTIGLTSTEQDKVILCFTVAPGASVAEKWVFHVGTREFSLKDATEFSGCFLWNRPSDLIWNHGDIVLVKLVEAGSTDATLSDLALADNSGTAITLSPSTFVSTTKSYTAAVTNSINEITITPTVNESNATYEIQNSSGTALTDADTNTTGFQVDLSVGATTIKVEVTAEDGTTETYTVVVTRAGTATCAAPNLAGRTQIWTGTLSAGEIDIFGTVIQHGFVTTSGNGSLSDTGFDVGMNSYTIDRSAVGTGESSGIPAEQLSFSLTSGLTAADVAALKLHVCDASFALSDATYTSTAGPLVDSDHIYTWDDTGLDWSSVTTRALYLSVPTASTVPTPTPGGPAEVAVPSDWSLIPAGLGPGDKFRLLFLSSTRRDASSSSISTYNSFIQGRAAAGHADIREYSDQFRVIGCTDTLNATDNTNTRSSDTDAPIYWLLGGNKVANNYADFYDGSWDNEGNRKNELGTTGLNTSQPSNYPWTGCDHHGVEAFSLASVSQALGTGAAQVGRLNNSGSDIGPLYGGVVATTNLTRPMYGLSPVFIVPVPTKVRFGSTGYHAIEGGAEATVVVVMYPRPSTQVDIPLTVTSLGTTTAADYEIFVNGSQETSDRFSLTFSPDDSGSGAGGIAQRFTVRAVADSANDHRDSVRFRFGSMPISTTIEGVTDGRAAKTATVWLLEVQDEMMDCSTPDSSAPDLGTLLNTYNPRRLNSKGQIKNSGDCIWFKVPNLANNRRHQFLLTGRWVHGVLSQITSPQIKIYKSDDTPLVQDGSAVEDQVLEADRRFRAPLIRFTPATDRNLLCAGLVVGLRCRPLYHFVPRHRAGDGARDGGRAPDGDAGGHTDQP